MMIPTIAITSRAIMHPLPMIVPATSTITMRRQMSHSATTMEITTTTIIILQAVVAMSLAVGRCSTNPPTLSATETQGQLVPLYPESSTGTLAQVEKQNLWLTWDPKVFMTSDITTMDEFPTLELLTTFTI